MRLNFDKLYSEIFILMTHCATADLEYLASNECANRFKNILENIEQYKDIENDFGIDLITLFKALKNGCYAKNTKGKIINLIGYKRPSLSFDENEQRWCFVLDEDICRVLPHHYLYLTDYGKTWALTKEELEK